MDGIMCAMMNTLQWRLRHHAIDRSHLEEYLDQCASLDRESYYALPIQGRGGEDAFWRREGNSLSWSSPLQGIHPENNVACAQLYETSDSMADDSGETPTIILLHALMSVNDYGYRRIATHFNKRGWNVLFPHLPYHYSRRLPGYPNGAFTITANLVRNAETLRQSVIELRQLIGWARRRGSQRIALLGTSYGAWVAALTLSLEMTDFTVLLQPVANIRHITFESPASAMMAGLLKKNGIEPHSIARHFHLVEPLRLTPMTPAGRIRVIGGKHDRISPSEHLLTLCKAWGGVRYVEVPQGHFGYHAMNRALKEADGFLEEKEVMSNP
jgi:pimeloyl-ACP methyl ester carboxylesterase